MTVTHTLMQAPPFTDYEAATAKVIGPDSVLDARKLQGKYRVYEVTHEVAIRIIKENAKVHAAHHSHRDERVKGACFIDELSCGCVYELPDGPSGGRAAAFQQCREHTPSATDAFCCDESMSFPCICTLAQWCPTHGERHEGGHRAHVT